MMSKNISKLPRELSSRNSSKPQPQTRAEEIQALERIKDPDVRAKAIAWHLKRQKIVDINAICLRWAVTIAGIIVALRPLSAKALVVSTTTLLAVMWRALKNNVFNSL